MQKDSMQQLRETSYLEGDNITYIEALYDNYLQDPSSVDAHWQDYFKKLNKGLKQADTPLKAVREHFVKLAKQPAQKINVISSDAADAIKESHVAELINAYRIYGHHRSHLDPLELSERHGIDALTLEYHGLSDADLNKKFHAGHLIKKPNASLQEILTSLEKTYCSTTGVEYMHISNTEEVDWLQQQMEPVENHPLYSKEEKSAILDRLTAAEGLEKFLNTKYVGQKRFSLEGGDSLIPMLDGLIHRAADYNVGEMVLGMAHRGRLNVLVNVLGKAPTDLFAEFEGRYIEKQGTGDVKYHKGFSSDVRLNGKTMHLSLAFNPSHLEIVGPVVEGSVRARQRRRKDIHKREQVMPVIMHGDAAFAGQGVVMETFSFSQARGFCTGGSIHIVINNQVGFTTSNPLDARSTLYCTDIAKMVQAPIFHVNGNDPEAVCFVAKLAMDYRDKFHKDVVIDLVCYRRQGHNEADDPSITQPIMYNVIKKLKTPRAIYADRLIDEGVIQKDDPDNRLNAYMDKLGRGEPVVKLEPCVHREFAADWEPHIGQELDVRVNTGVDKKRLKTLAKKLTQTPADFNVYRQAQKVLTNRDKMTNDELPIDWGYAENLAYASLLAEGHSVRLCGQDCGRGTFSHRHAELHDHQVRGKTYVPLQHVDKKQGDFIVIDSILSEEAVLAFEFGFTTADPDSLVIWEAQFGDFANGAQVVIDQFISSCEQKWNRLSGLTMLLPHGSEGMGPEHSSARLERFLQLCAQNNMQVCVPSTPAQIFHLLRRQVIRPARKPLIVMSPKSLLRHKLAVSQIDELAKGEFHLIIPEVDKINAKKAKRVVLCSGKVYYDLLQKRRDEKCDDVAIIRIEQQYPFPREVLSNELKKYTSAGDVIWCQEEPKNQGAWYQISHHLTASMQNDQKLSYAGRRALAAPSGGYAKEHHAEQEALVNDALGL